VAEEAPLVRAHLEHAEVLAVLRGRPVAGLAARDAERLAAVVAEHEADRLHRGSLEPREQPPVGDAGSVRGPRVPAGSGGRQIVARGDDPVLRHLAEPWVTQEPSVMLEEADDGRALSHRAHVVRELGP